MSAAVKAFVIAVSAFPNAVVTAASPSVIRSVTVLPAVPSTVASPINAASSVSACAIAAACAAFALVVASVAAEANVAASPAILAVSSASILPCNVVSADARVPASAVMLACNVVSALALALASVAIAVVFDEINAWKFESAAWKAATISVNESKDAGSVFEMIESILAVSVSMFPCNTTSRVSVYAFASTSTWSAYASQAVVFAVV